jgi:hypothetical protein
MTLSRPSPAGKMGGRALRIRIDRAARYAAKSFEPLRYIGAEALADLAAVVPIQWKGQGTRRHDISPQGARRFSIRSVCCILLVISCVLFGCSLVSLLCVLVGSFRAASVTSNGDNVRTGHVIKQGYFKDPMPLPGFSLIAACMNCHGMLEPALANWRMLDSIDEVVLVDWSSTPPIHETLELSSEQRNIRVVHVSGEAAWVPSRAFNVGIYFSRFSAVGLTDVEHSYPPTLFNISSRPLAKMGENGTQHNLFYHCRQSDHVFATRSCRSLVVSRDLIRNVGGYDERIVGGNWEVADLIERLELAHAISIAMDCATGQERAMADTDYAQAYEHVYNDLSWLIVQKLETWSEVARQATAGSSYAVNAKSRFRSSTRSWDLILLKAGVVQASALQHASTDDLRQAQLLLLGRKLHDVYGVPWELMVAMNVPARDRLLTNLIAFTKQIRDQLIVEFPNITILPFELPPPRLFVLHAMHGLGNRLRALTSAMSFAEMTGRQLIIVWETDEHCNAPFFDLFEPEALGRSYAVIEDLPLEWHQFRSARRYDVVWRDWVFYNYMEMEGHGAQKDRAMEDVPSKHIYFKSAYVISPADKLLTGWDLANKQLQYLKPVARVRSMVAKMSPFVDIANSVGVHIRSFALHMETEIDALREYGKNESEVLNFWRSRSDPQIFFTEMRRILNQDSSTVFYVASDSTEVVNRARELFPGRAFSMKEESCDSRGAACLQIALADMILLGKARLLLGSPWSSFTEGGQRFGAKVARIAGVDFGPELAADAKHSGPAVAAMLELVRERKRNRVARSRGRKQPS